MKEKEDCRACKHYGTDAVDTPCVDCFRSVHGKSEYEQSKDIISKSLCGLGEGPFKTQVGGNHYQDKFPFCQPSEFFARNNVPFMEGNVCKYALRHDLKNGIEDLRKAKHYLEMIAHCQYGEKI